MNIDKWSPIIVEWLDATGTRESHNSEEYVASYVPYIRRTVGFFLYYSEEKGLIITETDDRKGNGSEDCENITVVPACMVRRIVQLSPIPPPSVTPILDAPSKRLRRSRPQR